MTATADFSYRVDASWPSGVPANVRHRDVSAVGVDSQDRVFLLTRYDSNVLVFERDGTFVSAWGGEVFTNPHGLAVGPDDAVYCADNGDHTVRKFSPDGKLLMTLGQPGHPADTGYTTTGGFVVHMVETVRRPGPPFNGCTNVAVAPDGRIYVADGYGNCRVHAFSPEGDLIRSWGEVGVGAGQFHLVHGIGIGPDDRLYVCDRENDRIQIFDLDGRYLGEWTDVQRPCQVALDGDGFAYVAELWRPKGKSSFVHGVMKEDRPGRVTVLDRHGYVVARWGASTVDRAAPGCFVAPHGIAVDSRGDVYVSEVTYTFGIRANGLSEERHAAHQIQKFVRQRTTAAEGAGR